MANVHITAADQATTAIELPPDDAIWLADQLERFIDPSDTPAAATAAERLRQATTDREDAEVALTGAELDAIRRVLELEPDAAHESRLAQLRDEIRRWL